jgi:hypothetical protein
VLALQAEIRAVVATCMEAALASKDAELGRLAALVDAARQDAARAVRREDALQLVAAAVDEKLAAMASSASLSSFGSGLLAAQGSASLLRRTLDPKGAGPALANGGGGSVALPRLPAATAADSHGLLTMSLSSLDFEGSATAGFGSASTAYSDAKVAVGSVGSIGKGAPSRAAGVSSSSSSSSSSWVAATAARAGPDRWRPHHRKQAHEHMRARADAQAVDALSKDALVVHGGGGLAHGGHRPGPVWQEQPVGSSHRPHLPSAAFSAPPNFVYQASGRTAALLPLSVPKGEVGALYPSITPRSGLEEFPAVHNGVGEGEGAGQAGGHKGAGGGELNGPIDAPPLHVVTSKAAAETSLATLAVVDEVPGQTSHIVLPSVAESASP